MESNVAVVILNYNGKSFLEKLLPGVIAHSGKAAIYVADNGSTDDSNDFLKTHFPQVTIVSNPGNYGYAGGYNLALQHIQAKYYILVNSDIEVTPNWIEPLLSQMEKNPKLAACQPKLLDFNHRDRFEYAGASGGFIDAYGYPFCRGRLFNSVEEDKGQYNQAAEIFWATGACMMVRSEVFHQCGGFDSHYFAHMEEIDLCWRMKNIGYSISVEPQSVVYHVGGGTLDKLSTQKTFLNFRNNLSTLTKNHPSRFLLPKLIYRMILDGIAACKFFIEGQPAHFAAVIRAHFAYYRWIPRLLRERKRMRQHPDFKDTKSGIYRGNVVMGYFLVGKKKFSDLPNHLFSKHK